MKSRELIGKAIVTVTHGEVIGRVKDVLIDPERFEIVALVLPGKVFSKGTMILPRSVVQVFGKDVILVRSNEAMPLDDSLPNVSRLLAVSGQMKGRLIATEKGVRVGVINDVLVDENGRVVGYDLARVFIKGPVAESKQVPAHVTRSIGPDLIIVDSEQLESL